MKNNSETYLNMKIRDVENKINRLEQAKRNIEVKSNELHINYQNIMKNVEWRGKTFDNNEMIFNEVVSYINHANNVIYQNIKSIDEKIQKLEIEYSSTKKEIIKIRNSGGNI